jgi:cell division protein FtsI/penicillin-binding protein 2
MTTFRKQLIDERRLRFVALLVLLLATWVVARLFYLQVMRHDYYSLFALNTHEIYRKLHPVRGQIFVQDSRSKQEYPVAINKDFYLIYAVPKDIPEDVTASTTDALVRILGLSSGDQKTLSEKIAKRGSYAVVAKKVPEETAKMIESWGVRGVYTSPQTYRFYPEEVLAAPVIGFASPNDEGRLVGKYGVEGYWEKKLAGQGGFLMAERGVGGGWKSL